MTKTPSRPLEDVSKQIDPLRLQQPMKRKLWRSYTRLGSISSEQMRKLGDEGIPAICRSTLIDQSVASVSWEVLNPQGERDAQTEYFTLLLQNANDGEGFASFVSRFAQDILTTIEGGFFEIVLSPGDVPVALYNVDSVTIHATSNEKFPWEQRFQAAKPVQFRRSELAHGMWHPFTNIDAQRRNLTPIAIAYMYICILAASDDWNLDILSDQFPAGVLSLPGASEQEARNFKNAWDYAIAGGQLRDIAVIYGIELKQAQHIKFTRPPTDMAFEITNHWYSSLVAAAFEMSIMDISILTKVSTKAAAESQERTSTQQGQMKLRRIVKTAIENWILPEGYEFQWVTPRPEDIATQAKAALAKAQSMFYLVNSLGPDLGIQLAIQMGIAPVEAQGLLEQAGELVPPAMAGGMGEGPAGVGQRPDLVKSYTHGQTLALKADLRGMISLRDWEYIRWGMVAKADPPPDLWGEELYDWAMDEYGLELESAYIEWEHAAIAAEQEEDPAARQGYLEAAAAAFILAYRIALERAAYRCYIAGKQRDAETEAEAREIAEEGLTLDEIREIQGMIDDNASYFEGFMQILVTEGSGYTRAAWRTQLYTLFPRRFYLNGVVSRADPDRDIIEITQGSTHPCNNCPDYWGQYTVREYRALRPPPPPPNWCEGFDNCKCKVTVLRGWLH